MEQSPQLSALYNTRTKLAELTESINHLAEENTTLRTLVTYGMAGCTCGFWNRVQAENLRFKQPQPLPASTLDSVKDIHQQPGPPATSDVDRCSISTSATGTAQDAPASVKIKTEPKLRRYRTVCTPCRKGKTRCSRELPCGYCKTTNRECDYEEYFVTETAGGGQLQVWQPSQASSEQPSKLDYNPASLPEVY
ncbi:hypothetical protein V2W45_1336406 [Cenococcum geophilum]